MASLISAGTTSGTALNMSGDTSGVLQLASNNGTVGVTLDTSQNTTFAGSVKTNTLTSAASTALTLQSAGTTAVTIDTSQNVGIGTTTPDIFSRGYTKTVGISSSGSTALQINSTGDYPAIELGRGGVRKFVLDAQSTICEIASLEAVPMAFSTNSTERMRITSAGVVQVGNNAGTGEVFAQNTVKVWGVINSGSTSFYNSFGTSSISKISTGIFAIGFSRTFSSSRFGAGVTQYGSGFSYLGAESTTGIRINTTNSSGTLTDSDVTFLIAGGS